MSTRKSNYSKVASRAMKKMHPAYKTAIIIGLLIGIIVGAGACFVLSKNDAFEMNGNKVYSLEVGTPFVYHEEGITAKCFGFDVSDKVYVKTDLQKDNNGDYVIPTDQEGVYTIIYTVDALKFNGTLSGEEVQKVRTFIVNGIVEDGKNE